MAHRALLNKNRIRRSARTRSKLNGTAETPRLSVFRSNKFTYAQLIDDDKMHTVASVSSRVLSAADKKKTKTEQANTIGEALAKKAESLGVKKALFDRGSYRYHGRVQAVAEGARKAGLTI